jgi:hypothetical protein
MMPARTLALQPSDHRFAAKGKKMDEQNQIERQRLAAALAIEDRIDQLAAESGMTVMSAVWNLNQGMDHPGPHRLDVGVEECSARIYFTDNELFAYASGAADSMVDERLRFIISDIQEVEELPFTMTAGEEPPQSHWFH